MLDAPGTDSMVRDCWASWRAGTIGFGAAVRIDAASTTTSDEVDPSPTPDELTLFFARVTDATSNDPVAYYVQRAARDAPYGPPQRVPELVRDLVTRITVRSDAAELVYASTRAGGAGASDLWALTRADATVPYGPPTQARVSATATASSELDPALSASGLDLYFARANPTMSGPTQTILVASRPRLDAGFGVPVAVDLPGVPTFAADPVPSPDETVMVFTAIVGTEHDTYYALRVGGSSKWRIQGKVPGLDRAGIREGDATFSRDGCQLVFSATDATHGLARDLYVADALP